MAGFLRIITQAVLTATPRKSPPLWLLVIAKLTLAINNEFHIQQTTKYATNAPWAPILIYMQNSPVPHRSRTPSLVKPTLFVQHHKQALRIAETYDCYDRIAVIVLFPSVFTYGRFDVTACTVLFV